MKTLAIINKKILSQNAVEYLPEIEIAGNKIPLGIVEVDEPSFDINNKNNDDLVLVKVDAFSCNYRDKGIIVKAALNMKKLGNEGECLEFFGSDFVATVEKVGRNVNNVSVGDRVIPNCYYPSSNDEEEISPGVVTNEASKGWLKLHRSKVIRVNPDMDDAIAAAFSIGAQTSSSMIRKMELNKKDKILVTSGRSNTSQFIIKALLKKGIIPDVLSTSEWSEDEEEFISPAKIIKVNRGDNNWDNYKEIEMYDAIFDPFFDLYMPNSIRHLNMNGKYITCGYKNQHQSFREDTDIVDGILNNTILTAMINNITIIGNCIGLTSDLSEAINSFEKELPPIMIDRVYKVHDGEKFVNKTYNTRRFGKVILKYN